MTLPPRTAPALEINYVVIVKWIEQKSEDIFPMNKTQQFPFETFNDALDGVTDLMVAHTKLKDKIERWYRIEPYTPLDI